MSAAGPTPERGWRRVETADGTPTFAHPVHGETCHSRAGALTQARERYAAACRLAERARERRGSGAPVRLLDVGTGLGWNLVAALEALDGAPLEAVTLERDEELLRTVLAWARDPAWRVASPCAAPVVAALAEALVQPRGAGAGPAAARVPIRGAGGRPLGGLRLCLGDARATLPGLAPAERFDAVFLDPFSPAREPALWEAPFLAEIARRMAPGSWLSTYSAAFSVRLALARAGLRVGRGARVGTKAEGTVASPDREPPALPPRVARRLARALAAPARGDPPKAPGAGAPELAGGAGEAPHDLD